MRPVGEVVRAAGGLAVVRSADDDHPDVGVDVVDADLDVAGRVVDVFGPVDRPFVAVTPGGDRNPASLIGARLYERTG